MRHVLTALLTGGALMIATLSNAATLRIEATGEIEYVTGFASAGFAVGQDASLIWEYDTSAPVTSSSSGGGSGYAYYDATTFVSLTFNGQTFARTFAGNSMFTEVNSSRDRLSDQTSAHIVTFAGVTGLRYQIRWDGDPGFLSGTALAQIPDLSKMNTSSFRMVDFGTANDVLATFTTATITDLSATPMSPVPLPAGLPLLLVGLGVIGVAARRKTRNSAT